MPPSDQPFNPKDFLAPTARQETPRETFNGFPENFAHNLPTQEFMGDFARRTKRQAGVTSTIDGILSAPYGGLPATNHLQALLIRNANIRPPRQSVGPRRPKRPPPQPFPSISPPTSQSTAVGPPRFQPQFVRPQRDTVTSSLSPTRQHPLNRPPNFQVIHERFPEISSSSPDSSSSSDTAPSPQFSSPSSSSSRFSPSSSSSRFSPSSSARLSESSSARIPHAPSSSPLTFSFPSFSPPQQFSPSARERPVQSPEPFSFPSFTGQQFGSSDFDSFESARLPRQRRDAREGQDVSSQLGQTIASPGEGSAPSSISSVLSLSNRYPKHLQPVAKLSTPQLREHSRRRLQLNSPSSSHSFEIPFVIPNFFEQIGIRRRRDLRISQERQGITDAIHEILNAPYSGGVPESLQSLFLSDKNRFVRKIQPSTQHFASSSSFSNAGSNANIHTVGRIPPTSSSQFAGVHLPSSNNTRLNHIRTRSKRALNTQSTLANHDLQASESQFRYRRFRPLHHQGRRPHPHNRQQQQQQQQQQRYKNAEFGEPIIEYEFGGQDPSFLFPEVSSLKENNKYETIEVTDLSPFFGTEPSNFLSNFDSPLLDHASVKPTVVHESSSLTRPPKNSHENPRYPSKNFRRPHQFIPALRPGPSPPAHILPPFSSVRAPRHILMQNRRLPKVTRQQDIPLISKRLLVAQRRNSEEPVSSDAEAARQDSAGFIVGKPASFPGFHSIGGFGPMDALEKGNAAGSFMEDISFPSVDIPDINEKQPQFSPQQFQKQLFP
ncbi:hypothetical protein OTU49_002904 [Cherax quadricarinatus]|uniref:Uncharacterized protein n=1 Tax=Cherax quadricarinatus TaxID=27406 RepID=A0AAW0X7U7_CHEQU